MIFGKKSAQERVDLAENWSGRATLLILGGILLEVVLLFSFPHHANNWELWSLVAANAAIGVGLAVEYVCILGAINANAQLKIESDSKLSEALDRSSKAQENLEKYLTARRILIGPHKADLANKLKSFASTEFDVGFGNGDGEQADFVWDLEEVLVNAGWRELIWGVHAVGISVIQRGPQRPYAGSVSAQNLEIHMDPRAEPALRPAAEALVAALASVEIVAKIVPINIANTNISAMHLLAGPKR